MLALFWLMAAAADEPVVFPVPAGAKLRGVARANSSAFLGIRFAMPPTGSRRWLPPQPPPPLTDGVVNATALAPSCTQAAPPAGNSMSEDCLFLNVFTPLKRPPQPNARGLPVMLFIHGGCYVGDGTANVLFNGTNMVELAAAGAGDAASIVLVTVAYRLGPYGFLGGEELRARNNGGGGASANTTGNWGIQDQREAMRWVQANIAAFGGDPANVMIFGHSAGAGSVTVHLVAPLSRGLFQRAGILSGSFTNWATHSPEAAAANYEHMLAGVGCADLPCLLAMAEKDAARVRATANWGWTGVAPCRDGCAFAPQVDGTELPDWPLALAQAAAEGAAVGAPAFGSVPILHGSTLDDGYGFVKVDNFLNLTNSATAALCGSYRKAAWGDAPGYNDSALLGFYPLADYPVPANTNDDSAQFIQTERAETDFAYACAARWSSHYSLQAGAAVFRYVFAYLTPNGADAEFVPHGHDLPFLFQRDDDASMATDDAKLLARTLLGFWTRFAAHADPNKGASAPAIWPANEPTKDQALFLGGTGSKTRVVSGWRASACDLFWKQHWDSVGRCKLEPLGPLVGGS